MENVKPLTAHLNIHSEIYEKGKKHQNKYAGEEGFVSVAEINKAYSKHDRDGDTVIKLFGYPSWYVRNDHTAPQASEGS